MFAFAVDQQRIALYVEVRIFAHPDEMVNRLIFHLHYSAAPSASDLHMHLFAGDDFVQRGCPSPLPVDGM